jgi:hypothetical protein
MLSYASKTISLRPSSYSGKVKKLPLVAVNVSPFTIARIDKEVSLGDGATTFKAVPSVKHGYGIPKGPQTFSSETGQALMLAISISPAAVACKL